MPSYRGSTCANSESSVPSERPCSCLERALATLAAPCFARRLCRSHLVAVAHVHARDGRAALDGQAVVAAGGGGDEEGAVRGRRLDVVPLQTGQRRECARDREPRQLRRLARHHGVHALVHVQVERRRHEQRAPRRRAVLHAVRLVECVELVHGDAAVAAATAAAPGIRRDHHRHHVGEAAEEARAQEVRPGLLAQADAARLEQLARHHLQLVALRQRYVGRHRAARACPRKHGAA
eukprot:scaffold7746_cov350-Prasinococcus_capsulatus_cf.AAC.3